MKQDFVMVILMYPCSAKTSEILFAPMAARSDKTSVFSS